jgi:hypothetical protein
MYKNLLGIALTGVGLIVCAVVPAMADTVGAGDPFEITFSANGTGTINACTGSCSFGAGPDNGIAVTNVGGGGGNGYDFKLPSSVTTGIVDVYNSSDVLVAALDFINPTNLDYIVSGNLKDYLSSFSVIANANGSFTYEPSGAYPNNNQYNGSIPATPIPTTLPLFVTGLGLVGLLVWRGKRRNAAAVTA